MKKNNGFSLIEVLIYISLMSLILTGALTLSYQLISSAGTSNKNIIILDEANFMLRKINWAMDGVATINSPAVGASGQTLSVTKTGAANPIIFDLSSGNLRITESGGAAVILNSSRVVVAGLNFKHFAASGNKPESVKASFTVNGTAFETTKYLRK